MFLHEKAKGIKKGIKKIGISEEQLRYVMDAVSGKGIIKSGSVVVPFDSQISKDTDLYRPYNTNIHEIAEGLGERKSSTGS